MSINNSRRRDVNRTADKRPLVRRIAPWLIAPLAAISAFFATGQVPPPLPPTVAVAVDPLYAAVAGDKPAMVLALSVEWPTVGAQYVNPVYSNTSEYLGYYDAESCYRYNGTPSETPAAGLTADDYKRFDRIGAAASRKCNDAFSGNFLNWATSSAIDMLRLSLTGGDRYIDTPSQTILQRAVLPNGDPVCMWNHYTFPAKKLDKDGGGTGTYWGAVPNVMITAAGGNHIWVANRLNQIYFKAGTAASGSCTDQSAYNLGGGPPPPPAHGTPVQTNTALPTAGMTKCADEGNVCAGFSGVKEIWYGKSSKWKVTPATSGNMCDDATFGDPGTSKKTANECWWRDAPSGTTWTAPSGPLTTDGFFYSRVQVCNVNSGVLQDVRDYGLCKKYPSGNFKPTGAIQKYSDQLRLAAFGYLMDQTRSFDGGRFGGVLRAPMKYVGAKTFDINGVENTPTGGNAAMEWNANTGVFNVNPEGDTTFNKSGVISYLNQFGRTGAVPGRYKRYDSLGEMYGEGLRYLQGLAPTPEAISSITTDMKDGFPVYTAWTDPYGSGRSNTADYSCLKSNIAVIGDVNTHDSNRVQTRLPNVAANLPDIGYWQKVVQDFEAGIVRSYADGQNVTRSTGNPNSVLNTNTSYGNSGVSPFAGLAYWAHTHDIRGATWTAGTGPAQQRRGLRVKTFVFDVNEGSNETPATKRRYNNHLFTGAKYGGFEADPTNPAKGPFNTFGNPFLRDDGTVDKYVWEDSDPRPSRVGEANTYYLQSDARGVLSAFDDIFSRASTQARSIGGGSSNSKNLAQGNSSIYQGSFDTSDWSGDLLSIPLTVDTSNLVSVGTAFNWQASQRLTSLSNPATTRKIFMGRAGATSSPTATPFSWALPAGSAGIDAAARAALDKPSPSASADGLGQERLNYLRGDKANESTLFRPRKSLLGDIVNSNVVFSGAPATNISSSSYVGFYNANVGRTPVVFVGANDGMLHAFNANTGDEVFGYIPSWMAQKLSALTDSLYVNNHQAYVDGQLTVAEAQIGSAGTSADWSTVLVGATGAGGQGVFALNVTDPSSFNASKVMWEFTDADDPDLGNVVGRPRILKFRISAPAATPVFKYFAVVGSGVNNYANDGNASTTGNPALFLLDLSKAAGSPWNLGSNYYKITLPMDASVATTNASGLINFSAAIGAAGQVTKMYMGDLHGNLWKLDFTMVAVSDWNMAKLSSFKKGSSAPFTPYPLYVARDGTTAKNVQPITMAPAIAYGPVPEAAYVMFGTGKFLESGDKLSTAQQSVYAVYDNGSSAADASPIVAAISGRGRLQAGTVGATTGVVSVPAFKWGRATSNGDTSQRSGWYFDFPKSGEREISNATIISKTNTIIFGSLIPASSASSGACGANSGGGNLYTLNLASGNGTSVTSSAGILGEPLVLEISSATTWTNSDSAGRGKKTVTSQIIQQGSLGLSLEGGTSPGGTEKSTINNRRLSWRQINNYLDLKNAP